MPSVYKHDFFVSYPHMPHENILTEFVDELVKKIRYLRTGDQLPEPVYVDKERLKPGFRWKPELARALCHSRAMLAIYTADYFSREYCVREWDVMTELEGKRLGKSARSMIIPILFRAPSDHRGEPDLPALMKDLHYEDFRSILAPKRHFRNMNVIKQVANVLSRIDDLRRLSREPKVDCDSYNFRSKSPVLLTPPDPYSSWGR
jgi:hypothetical protein